jgi:hypothetical protein
VPFLRVVRDKRGYETTYLMHWFREGTRQRSRILYVFRTPGGARVGREALEPEVLRDIESLFPAIAFDWKAVLSNRQVIESAPEPRRRRRRPAEGEAGEGAVPEPAPAPTESASVVALSPPAALPSIPSRIEGATPDEQIAFLTRWYPIVRERIPMRTVDPARREALTALAERLNPATWTDADQIAAGLERAAEALERLAHVFARRRRRPRRSPARPGAPRGVEPRAGQGGPTPDAGE